MSNQYPMGPQYPTHDMGDGLPPVVLPPGVAPPAQPRPLPVPMGPSAAQSAGRYPRVQDELADEERDREVANVEASMAGRRAGSALSELQRETFVPHSAQISQRSLVEMANKFEDAKVGHQLTAQDLAHLREIIPLAAKAHAAMQVPNRPTAMQELAAAASPTAAGAGRTAGEFAAPMLAKLQAARGTPPAAPPASMATPIQPPTTDADIAAREAELNRRLQASKGAPPQ